MPFLRREHPIGKEELERLYLREQLSMAQIAERLHCSPNKVAYWMGKHGIERRGIGEAVYLWSNPHGNPFQIKELKGISDSELFNLGIGLYIGEGTKSGKNVTLANADPQVIRTFLRFLRELCGVEEKKIYAWLNIYDDVDLREAQAYWERVTGLSRSQFYKPTIRPTRGGSYQQKSRYGTLTIGVSNRKLALQIDAWCKEALHKYS